MSTVSGATILATSQGGSNVFQADGDFVFGSSAGAMMVLAAVRFRKIALDIGAKEIRAGPGARLDIALVMLLVLLRATLFVYLVYTVISGTGLDIACG